MEFDNEIVFRIPAPSDGMETVLVLFGIATILVAVLAALQHRGTVARIWEWVKAHPSEKASATVNLLSWGALIFVGPVAAILFVMAVGEAFALLRHEGGSDAGIGSLGRGAVIVALIGAPFVIWRSVVAQKTVNVTEQGHITDRINTAVQGLGAEKTVKRQRKNRFGNLAYAKGDEGEPDYAHPIMEEVTQPNLEVRIGAIYALERIATDSDRDHVQIMEILCAYIRQNAPAPETDDWPELEMKDSEEDGPLEADWYERLESFQEASETAKAKLKNRKPREDIQTALTVIGRRSAKQRRLEAGRGIEADFPFDTPCPAYDGPDEDHDPDALKAYLEKLAAWKKELLAYQGYRLDLRSADLRGTDLAELDLSGAKLHCTFLQGAVLIKAQLQGALLGAVRLQGGTLRQTQLHGANIEGVRLQAADLTGAQLQGADIEDIQLQGARLGETQLQGAVLLEAHLQGAHLGSAQLQGVHLGEVRLQGAFLWNARLQGARLGLARLQAAELVRARLQGALLVNAQLQGADLLEAQLNGALIVEPQFDCATVLNSANLQKSAFARVNFTEFPQIFEHLEHMFGDASVTLPGGHGPGHESWPAHWPKFVLGDDFQEQWQAWQADPARYRPPDPPEPDDPA